MFNIFKSNKNIEKRTKTDFAAEYSNNYVTVYDALFGGNSVTIDDGLNFPIFMHCVELISKTVGKIDLNALSSTGKNSNHIFRSINSKRVNSFTTLQLFLEAVVRDYICYGNSYWEIDNNGYLYRLEPLEMEAELVKTTQGYKPVYTYKNSIVYSQENLLHFKQNLSDDCITGESTIIRNAKIIGEGIAIYTYSEYEYSKGATKTLFQLKEGTSLSKDKQQDFLTYYNNRAKDAAFVPNGLTPVQITEDLSKHQLSESRQAVLKNMCNIFNIPVNYILNGGASGNISEQNRDFLNRCIITHLKIIEDELTLKLGQGVFRFDFAEESLYKLDKSTVINMLKTQIDTGIITLNEARQQLGLNPVEGGDILKFTFNNGGIDSNTGEYVNSNNASDRSLVNNSSYNTAFKDNIKRSLKGLLTKEYYQIQKGKLQRNFDYAYSQLSSSILALSTVENRDNLKSDQLLRAFINNHIELITADQGILAEDNIDSYSEELSDELIEFILNGDNK